MDDLQGVRVAGPLGPYARGFAGELARLGYRSDPAQKQLQLAAQLSRWLADAGLDAADLDAPAVGAYLTARRAAGYGEFVTPRALAPLLGYLRRLGVAPLPEAPVPQTLAEELLDGYRRWLLAERGLRCTVARGYLNAVRPFVTAHATPGLSGLRELAAADVTAFLLAQSRRLGPKTLQRVATALRSLLRFWHLQGLTGGPLDRAVPKTANRRPGLPRPLEPGQVAALLASCDRETAAGQRDLAMLVLLARLGLRAGEVAALTLDDIDWRAAEISIAGKGGRRDRLPLPADVGQAIAAYLLQGRPAGALDRSVFIRDRAPRSGLTPGAVTQAVAAAARRAGRHLRAPAAARRSHGHACRRRVAGRDRPGAPAPPRGDHRGVYEGQHRGAADAGAPVAGSVIVTGLRQALAGYLELRRGLGFKLDRHAGMLGQFVSWLEDHGAATVTTADALAWVTLPERASPGWLKYRMQAVRGFAAYLATLDPATEVPPPGLLPGGPRRAVPYLYSGADIAALFAQAGRLQTPLRQETIKTLIGLMAVTGIRGGEALALDDEDFDPGRGLLLVRHAKLGRHRLLPLHPTTVTAVQSYRQLRDRCFPRPRSRALLVSAAGTRLIRADVGRTFTALAHQAGLAGRPGTCRPRPHDLRHSFAVATLLDWSRDGGNVAARMPLLSAYLGHADPRHTYWYLTGTPELLAEAARRLTLSPLPGDPR